MSTPLARRKPRSRKQDRRVASFARHLLLIATSIIILAPIGYMVLASFKSVPDFFGNPYGLPTDWAFWEQVDREHLARCDEVLVLMLEGWLLSRGVTAEIEIARELGKPVRYSSLEAVVTDATLAYETLDV